MTLRDILLEAALPPISLLIPLLLALLFWRRPRWSRALLLAATLLFFLAALPVVGELLTRPLAGAAAPLDPRAIAAGTAAVLAPTAGVFQDARGRWWPSETSIRRAAAGAVLAEALGLPLILAGGNPVVGAPSEARVLAARGGFSGGDFGALDLRVAPEGRDSAETAEALAAMLAAWPGRPGTLILATSPSHVARMAASLRHHGLAVLVAPEGERDGRDEREARAAAGRWLPRWQGLGRTRAALYEYAGIAWYLLSGRITLGDLDL